MPFNEDNTHPEWYEPEGVTLDDGSHALAWVDAAGRVHLSVCDADGKEVEIELGAKATRTLTETLESAAALAAECEEAAAAGKKR